MPTVSLDALDLAALLCSRVCHDVISPVGAIVNGLELLEDEKDPEMREGALSLIKSSADTASARLQFCRLAFGAAGSAGASIDTGDAEQVTRNLLVNDRTQMNWDAPRLLLPKNKVKVLLNMCLIAATAIPRGGEITVKITRDAEEANLSVEATGRNVRLAHGVAELLQCNAESGEIDAHGIQAYYTGLVAQNSGMDLSIFNDAEKISIAASPTGALSVSGQETSIQDQSAA